MKINYGVFIPTDTPKHKNPKKRRKFITGSIEMNITQEEWDKSNHKDVRDAIRAAVPNLCSWHGYCIAPAEPDKTCKLINSQFSWILEVDGKSISFQGFDNADYFEEHYEN